MKLSKAVLWTCVCLLLVGCAPNLPEADRVSTSEPVQSLSAAGTFLPSPTLTFAPGLGYTSVPTLTPTMRPIKQPTRTPTPLPAATHIPTLTTTPMPMSEVTAIEMPSASPDGQWKATVLENQQRAILRVSSADGAAEWIAETITSTDIWGGFEWAIPFVWSQYGHYLYFTHYERTDGCAPEFHGSDLQRLDLQTGEVTELAPKVGYWLALSPDERTLAYLSFEKGLVLRELPTGEERSARPAIYEAYPGVIIFVSHLVWSPDGKTLMFTAEIGSCDMPDFVSTSVIRVDAETLSQIELIRESNEWLTAIEWPDVERVLLKDRDGQHWWMNATTGEVTGKEE